MSTKTVAVAAAALLSTLAVSAGSANAGGRHFHGFHNHHHGLYLRIGPTYRDCSFYREMWEDTGSFKWKRRYYQCKGWW